MPYGVKCNQTNKKINHFCGNKKATHNYTKLFVLTLLRRQPVMMVQLHAQGSVLLRWPDNLSPAFYFLLIWLLSFGLSSYFFCSGSRYLPSWRLKMKFKKKKKNNRTKTLLKHTCSNTLSMAFNAYRKRNDFNTLLI